MKSKKIICILIMIVISILFFYSLSRLIGSFFLSEYEVVITNKNRIEISKMLESLYNNPNKINRIRFEVLLGEGELKLYNYLYLEKEIVVDDSDEIAYYVCENGRRTTEIYLFELLIETIILLYAKSIFDIKSD